MVQIQDLLADRRRAVLTMQGASSITQYKVREGVSLPAGVQDGFRVPLLFESSLYPTSLLPKTYISTCFC